MDPPTLRTGRLLLRPFSPTDATRVQVLAGSRDVASTTLNIPHPYEDGMAEIWIRTHLPAWEAGKRLSLAVTTEGDGLIGTVSLRLTPVHRRGEVGYWIGVPFWNNGYATEATCALMEFGFNELDLHRINARHLTRNPASGRVMQKLGMVQEGTLREHLLKWGRFEDVDVYAILQTEWQARTARTAPAV